jgi:carboxyl-terminal processing protease
MELPLASVPPAQNAPAPNATVTVPPPDPREAALSKVVLELFEEDHLLHKKIDDDTSRTAFATYIDRLDGGKMFLLKADRDALDRYVDKIDDELRSGSLDLAHDGAKIFAARVGVVDKLVTELLASPLNHTDEEWVELDPKKVQVAETEQQLRDRWRQRLELEVLERVAQMEARLDAEAEKAKAKAKGKKPTGSGSAADPKDDEEKSTIPLAQIPATHDLREAKARADLAKSYAGRFARLRTPAPLDAAADLVNAVASTLDPHTTYLPPAEKANFDIHMSGSLEGIGAVLRERDHYIEIIELVPGGASWRQGSLTPGDLILSVTQTAKDPVDVADMRIDEVVSMIRGPKGTVVRLRVQKAAGTEETVAITRDVVVVEEAYARGAVLTRKNQPAFGYIHLPSFYGGKGAQHTSAADMHRLFAEMKMRKVAGIVLDIRSNGGGLLGDAVKMTGDLIDQGPVVQVKGSRGRTEVLTDEKPGDSARRRRRSSRPRCRTTSARSSSAPGRRTARARCRRSPTSTR